MIKRIIIVFVVVLLPTMLFYNKWNKYVTGGGDSWGYFVYLPATLLHGDIDDLETCLDLRKQYNPGSLWKGEDGRLRVLEAHPVGEKTVIKYTYGVALMNLPGFLIAHVLALMSDYPADGYSLPYIFMLFLSSFLYVLIGTILLYKVLSKYFQQGSTFIGLMIILLGSNLYFFTVLNNVMSHPILYFLWALLIYATDNYYVNRKLKYAVLLAFALGMICVIRPTEVIAGLIPLFWNIKSWKGFQDRITSFFTSHISHLLLIAIIGVVCVLPQVVYWYSLTGDFVHDSYPGEHFNFKKPKIFKGLFSMNNGWLIYSPVMFLSLLGIPLLWKKEKEKFWIVSIVFVIHIYIIYSWWNWFYINGFGSRPMVSLYPLLAFPMVAFIQYVNEKWKTIWKWILGGVVVVLILKFWFMVYQHHLGVIRTDYMNRAMYAQSLFSTSYSQELSAAKDLDTYQYGDMVLENQLALFTFEDSIFQPAFIDGFLDTRGHVIEVNSSASKVFGEFKIDYTDLYPNAESEQKWLMIETDVYVKNQISDFWKYTSISIKHIDENGKNYKEVHYRLNNKPGPPNSWWWGNPHEWDTVKGYLKPSSRFRKGHSLVVALYQPNGPSKVFIDNLKIGVAKRNG